MNQNETAHLEIERRFLIARPEENYLDALEDCAYTDIEQTYLLAPEPNVTERVRKRGVSPNYVYTHTRKIRLSSATHEEDEREITKDEYETLKKRADPERNVIFKRRYVLSRSGHAFEIDLYPFWKKQAVMEVELHSEAESVTLPGEIRVLREITGNRAYSNAALSKKIPAEDE